MNTINLDMLDCLNPTIRAREEVDLIFSKINWNEVSMINLNFEGVHFVSRSFADELIKRISKLKTHNYTVEIINPSIAVEKMLKQVQKVPEQRPIPPLQFIDLKTDQSLEQFLLHSA